MSNMPWFIGVMIILWVAWFATGGPDSGRTERPFLRPPPPLDTGEIYGPKDLVPREVRVQGRTVVTTRRDATPTKPTPRPTTPTTTSKPQTPADESISIFGGKVSFTFKGRTGATQTDPAKEYVEIVASRNNTQPINITGWVLKSAITGKSATIEKGSYLPYMGRVNTEDYIFLRPGEEAIIATGHSPVGVSIRLNSCTGYFEQFQNFTPFLPLNCPLQKSEALPSGITDTCIDFVERIPRCEAFVKAIPLSLANDPVCQEYIAGYVHYGGCVELHKDDKDFYKPLWRIFLKRDLELWKAKRETILLLDQSGKTVDSLSY